MNLNKKGGFTLIELLVVIAIIGILSAIAVVNLQSARQRAKIAAAQAAASNMVAGLVLCTDTQGAAITSGRDEGSGPVICGQGSLSIFNTPQDGSNFCTVGTLGKWPTIGSYGFGYLPCQYSSVDNSWLFAMKNSDDECIVCTSTAGCSKKVSATCPN